jgi:hypothetical protein
MDEYLELLASLPPDSRSIALGDLYLGRPGVSLPELPPAHRFLRGNHDDPALARSHSNFVGDFGFLAPEGIFYVGGALTVSWRVLGNSRYWYRDEELSVHELEVAIGLYASTKPPILIAHEFPQEAVPELLRGLSGNYFESKGNCADSRTSIALQRMLEIHRPEKFFGGHYHVVKEFTLSGTRFRCLKELEVCEVEAKKVRCS